MLMTGCYLVKLKLTTCAQYYRKGLTQFSTSFGSCGGVSQGRSIEKTFTVKESLCLTSTETIRLIRDGEKGGGGEWVWSWGKREIVYLSLHCHHQNDSCIKMGSDESHFNVSARSDGQSHRTVSTNHSLSWRERRAEAVSSRGPFAYQPNALPLGQTGSRCSEGWARVNLTFFSKAFLRVWEQEKIACSRTRIRRVWSWVWQRVNVFLRLQALVYDTLPPESDARSVRFLCLLGSYTSLDLWAGFSEMKHSDCDSSLYSLLLFPQKQLNSAK